MRCRPETRHRPAARPCPQRALSRALACWPRAFLPVLAGLLCVGLWTAPSEVLAQEVRLLVQRSPLAGFRHYEARAVFARLAPGERLELAREPDNPHDTRAVRVEWRGHKLGYVPRAQNAALAWTLDAGEPLSARVARLDTRPYRRIEFEVFAD